MDGMEPARSGHEDVLCRGMDEGHGFAKKSNADFAFYTRVMFAEQWLGARR